MNIKRVSVSQKICVYPSCNQQSMLRSVPMNVRVDMMKNKILYIPKTATVCSAHRTYDAWCEAPDSMPEYDLFKYSSEQIEDFVKLLCTKSSRVVSQGKKTGNN